jgi:hypothetical protein
MYILYVKIFRTGLDVHVYRDFNADNILYFSEMLMLPSWVYLHVSFYWLLIFCSMKVDISTNKCLSKKNYL